MIDSIKELLELKHKTENLISKAVQDFEKESGIPVKNIYKDVTGLSNPDFIPMFMELKMPK